jgi:hypothetical protein
MLQKRVGIKNLSMKQGLSLLRLSIVLSLASLSCTKTSTPAKETSDLQTFSVQPKSSTSRVMPDCPPGTHPVLAYSFDEFHFHRPKYACLSGFWFCTVRGSGWHIECVPNNTRAYINGTSAYVWAKELDNQLEFHFPLDLKSDPNYTREDLSTFNVDEAYLMYEGITLKPGDYPVRESDTELIVIVDLL